LSGPVLWINYQLLKKFVLRELNRLGRTDAHVAWELCVARSTISKWRHGRIGIPEQRAQQLKDMLAAIRRKGEPDRDIVVERAHYKQGMAAEVRRMLGFLSFHGWDNSRVACFCGVSRVCSQQKWDSLPLRIMDTSEATALLPGVSIIVPSCL